ncbi:MAG: zinc transporter ZntB [Kiloniellales bacterium]|jgi:zinc transporter|nr:zinc transporter ZntB [Kiloniellales bacterium]
MDEDGLIAGFLLDGNGGGQAVDWQAIEAWQPDQGVLWVHLDRHSERACQWVQNRSRLDRITADALLAEETRPRSVSVGQGLLVILRGVNLNPGADPEDMVSLRLYADDRRIISVRLRRLMAVSDLTDRLTDGQGPRTTGDFLAMVADLLVARMEPVIDSLGEGVDLLETELSTLRPQRARHDLRELRHTAIVLRRYLTPQRDIMGRLQMEAFDWLSQHNRLALREVGDRIARYVEELEEVRERAAVLQDELLNRLSETANRTIYLLTIVAAIMLPLSFVTGLLGINVGGMPGVDDPRAFWLVCLLLLAFAIAEIWIFRKLKWF